MIQHFTICGVVAGRITNPEGQVLKNVIVRPQIDQRLVDDHLNNFPCPNVDPAME